MARFKAADPLSANSHPVDAFNSRNIPFAYRLVAGKGIFPASVHPLLPTTTDA